jgi:hypothetical protein
VEGEIGEVEIIGLLLKAEKSPWRLGLRSKVLVLKNEDVALLCPVFERQRQCSEGNTIPFLMK